MLSVIGAWSARHEASSNQPAHEPTAPFSPRGKSQSVSRHAAPPGERILRLYNTHTGESLRSSVFWAEGQFIPDALQDINKLLRDHRNNKVRPWTRNCWSCSTRSAPSSAPSDLARDFGLPLAGIEREAAREHTGVAKHSLHMEGKAIDVRIPGKDLPSCTSVAMSAKAGGVGYYPDSQFVHMDVGRVRYW
jgi:uncharacterized protein YcbK (DUF882 family)